MLRMNSILGDQSVRIMKGGAGFLESDPCLAAFRRALASFHSNLISVYIINTGNQGVRKVLFVSALPCSIYD